MRSTTVVLLCLMFVGTARSEEEQAEQPPKRLTHEQSADAVLAAFHAEDHEALVALAEEDRLDPWIVADELCHRGEHDAAEAFARAAARKAVERLPEYVASRRGKVRDQEARRALAAMNTALTAEDWQGALTTAPATSATLDSVPHLRLAYGRGLALQGLGRLRESAEALVDTGNMALRLGWLRRASRAFHEGGVSAGRDGDWRRTVAAWTARLAVAEALGDRPGVCSTLNLIGMVQCRLGEYAEALANHRRSLEIAEALSDRPGICDALNNIGIVQRYLGEYTEALASYRRSITVKEALGDRRGIAGTLVNIGNIQDIMGKYAEALVTFRRSLEISEALGDRATSAKTLNNMGNVQDSLGEYAEALASYLRSLEIKEALGDRQGVCDTLNNIGVQRQRLGKYDEALATYRRTLEMAQHLGDRQGVSAALNNIAAVQESLGEYAQALSGYRRSFEMAKTLKDRGRMAETLNNIGVVQWILGEHVEALATHRRSLEMRTALGDRPGVCSTLNNIGIAHRHLGEYTEALASFHSSLEMSEGLGDRAGASRALTNIGVVQDDLGKYAEALASYRRSLALAEALGDRQGVCDTLNSLGITQANLGEHAEALASYRRSLQMAAALRDRRGMAKALSNIGGLQLARGEYAQALGSARQGVELVAELATGLAEGEGASAGDVFSACFDVGYRAACRTDDASQLAWFLESGRARSLRESLASRDALEAAVIPGKLRKALGLARTGERRALEAYRRADEGGLLRDIRVAGEELDEARKEVRRVVRHIEREAKRAAAITLSDPDDLETIRKGLGPGDVLLYYVLTTEEAAVLVVRQGKASIVNLGASADIEAAADALLEGNGQIEPPLVRELGRLLATPLDLGEDGSRVLISPMGQLGYVPFELLFPECEVAYVPSGTTYGLLLEERAKRGAGVLALGDPDYRTIAEATAASTRGAARHGLVPLPATREEVKAIGTTSLLGMKASESSLQSVIASQNRWRAVHFACHGLVDPERPMLSALALTADAENDGFLKALEIFRMRIPADLVVMSACETGKGRIYITEGVVGLTRAFMFAGAPRVICSLWDVDDESTRALMVKFYELWNPDEGEGLGAAAALKKAQEFVRDHPDHPKWKHPHYWAAWVLWGLPD